jgi:chromate transporter
MTSVEVVGLNGQRESLWRLFWVVCGLSAVSWGGLALMAQLERHYVERKSSLTALAFADLTALAWMVPGPVGCNVAVQLGHALRGRAGAWVAGVASVLPFFLLMTVFAIFYRTPLVHAITSQTLVNHFSVVLAVLIGVTWHKQTRAILRGRLEYAAAGFASAALMFAHGPAAYVLVLLGMFAIGWMSSPRNDGAAGMAMARGGWTLLAVLAALLLVFALPLSKEWQFALLWPRLAGAGLTLFGGGFSALPVLKALFVSAGTGVSDKDFTLAFALSPMSPGPLLNVVPFFGYLIDGWLGALIATAALFVPSGCLVIIAQRHLGALRTYPRFESGMRLLRAATTAFLAIAVFKIATRIPMQPAYFVTAAFGCMCLAKLKLPVYAVYAAVAVGFGVWMMVEG